MFEGASNQDNRQVPHPPTGGAITPNPYDKNIRAE
jgi:hypothetical protein